jgi:hypothetical protein
MANTIAKYRGRYYTNTNQKYDISIKLI